MVFGETSRPAGRLVSPKTMETDGLSRAEGSRFASATAQRLDLDAEHGSGRRRPQKSRIEQSLLDLPNFGYSIFVANSKFQR
jgi:hypothetical protein